MKLLSSLVLILLCSFGYAQIVYDTVPINKQLVGRDLATNTGDIIINGNVDNSGVTYDSLKVNLYRDGVLLDSIKKPLVYNSNLAPFDFKLPIVSEFSNYKVEIIGKNLGFNVDIERTVDSLVAGDVFIINGQSNAEAESYNGSANGNQDDFIRVYANGAPFLSNVINNDKWYIGQGDGRQDTNGNTGQWGLKLAKMLIDSLNIPVAIFNGAHPGQEISFFTPNRVDVDPLSNNYQRLYYRLDKTGLKEKVKAVFWSQGENDGVLTLLQVYKNRFNSIQNGWLNDFPNIEKIYIFQTTNGCPNHINIQVIKEAQRQLAFEDPNNISIMPVSAAIHNSDNCHFVYSGGYELFAERIFELVYRDIYNVPTTNDIDAPMIIGATQTNPTTLVVETDAISSLTINSTADNFLLEDASQVDITNTITATVTSGNEIIFTLSANPGPNATISYLGPPASTPGNFIVNQQGIEIVCFYRYPITIETPSPLLITQYYEGAGPNDQWIEIKNISQITIADGDYYLALFDQLKAIDGTIQSSNPDQFVAISGGQPDGSILPEEVVLFRNTTAPSVPLSGNLGSAHTIPTDVCTYTGDDVILISSSNDNTSFNNRIDVIGVVAATGQSPPNWGEDKSLIKGCNTTELPTKIFDQNGFIELALSEVDNAASDMNIALGTQKIGATTWTSGNVWDNGTTDRTRSAIITGSYAETYGSLSACKLVVQGIFDFSNSSTNYLEVTDSLIVETGAVMGIGDKATLYTVNASNSDSLVTIIGSIDKLETTTSLNDSGDYTYWSSPMENLNMSSVFAPGTYQQTRLYYWDQSVMNLIPGGGSEILGEWISATGSIMKPGKGYISQSPIVGTYPMSTGATVAFSGKPNTGKIQLIGSNDVVFNDDFPIPNQANDLNLIGNPYPSAIDAHKLLDYSTNQNSIGGTIWFWTHYTPNNQNPTGEQYTNDDYASYNLTGPIGTGFGSLSNPTLIPTRYIGSGQGFMIQAISAVNDTITFTDSMREKENNTQFFRGVNSKNNVLIEKDRVWLNLESSEGGAFSQILVGFFENATDGFDRLYDGIKISEGWVNLYSKIDTLNYGIQGLSTFGIEKKVPLAFNSYIDDASVTYNISIDRFEGILRDNDIYLVDNELNVIHDLNQGAYNFSIPSYGSYANRFTLQFAKTTLDVDELSSENNFAVSNEENRLLVKANKVIKQIKVYDITGRLLLAKKPFDSSFEISTYNIRKGTVLILNATFENGSEISKKAIKY